MFWTASTAIEDDQHEDSGRGRATYELCSKELGPVNITRKLVLCRVTPTSEGTYHGTHIYTEVEKIMSTISESTTHDVSRRFESAAFFSLTWAFWVALNWILS